jgi:hypothetical protein
MLSQPTQKLIQRYQAWYQSLQIKEGVPTIHVDEVASAVASFYEKIRGVVEWKEEHLLRRAAIERILKRRLLLQKNGEEIAEPFVLELIRGGHFPNDRIEERKIEEVKRVLDKYLFILKNSPSPPGEKLRTQLYDWLLGICACEVEETLSPSLRETALIEYMTELMKERIKVVEEISQEETEKQIYIAVQRALFKLDSPIISYHLLKRRYSDWSNLPEIQLKEITTNIYSIWEGIEKDLKHSLAEKFYQICERYDTPYLILGDIISQNPSQASENLSKPEILENLIRESYQKRLLKLRSRISRAAIYSTISILVTKMLLAFAIEVPFDKYVTGEFSYQALGFNILIPPLLMFFLVLTIRPPKKENLDRVIMEVIKIVYPREEKDVYTIKIPKKRGIILNTIIVGFYLLTFFVSFGVIIWGLNKLNFGTLSIIIFLMFFCLIFFAGVKIRERSKELQVLPEKSGFLTFLVDSFFLPFIRVGKWLSNQLTKYNIVLVLITALIEMPFQLFTEFLENWRLFLKEKKEEIH